MMNERKDSQFRGQLGVPLALDAKQLTEDGEFEGYASVFGERDQGDDIVLAGAFSESLRKRPAEKIKLLWQHNTNEVIGKWLEMREDQRGLYCKGKLFLGVQKAKECLELMREGAVDGLSIGFRTLVDEYDRQNGVRRLLKVDLREVSVVTFPMLESAIVALVKGDQLPSEREFERWLVREAGFSAKQAKGIIANGFKSLLNERDAGSSDVSSLKQAVRELSSAFGG